MKKGITPVIAVVLLISVVVAATFVVYESFATVQDRATGTELKLPISPNTVSFESCWGTPNDPNFSIRNTGSEAINVSELPVRVNTSYLDSTEYRVSPQIVNPQETVTLDVNPATSFNSETEISLILQGESVSYRCRNID